MASSSAAWSRAGTQYRLTPMGEELRPAVGALRAWAQRWL